MRWVSDATRAQRTPQRVSLSTDEESGLFLSGLERRFTSLCFGVEALEAVNLRINIRSAILIWIVMPVWAFFYVKMWVRVGNSSRRFSREPSIRLLAKLSVWLCLVIFNQAFCPSPNKLSGGGGGGHFTCIFHGKNISSCIYHFRLVSLGGSWRSLQFFQYC